jgi:hypothetical protein
MSESVMEDFIHNHVIMASPAVIVDDIGLGEKVFKNQEIWSFEGMKRFYSHQKVSLFISS